MRGRFQFYESCLGGKIVFKMTNGESPVAKVTPPERHNQILHIRLMVGDKVLMGSDAPSEYYEKPQGFSVTLGIDTPAEAECFRLHSTRLLSPSRVFPAN